MHGISGIYLEAMLPSLTSLEPGAQLVLDAYLVSVVIALVLEPNVRFFPRDRK